MADDLQGKSLSEFSTVSIVSDDTLFFASKPNDLTNTGYDTVGVPGSTLKNLLNEELYVDLTSTLAIGETSLTFNDARITSTSVIDIYTDTFGVNPTAVTTSTGSITLTFSEQEAIVSVKVRLWLSDKGAIIQGGSMTSLDSGVPRSTVQTDFTLSDNISNYDLLLVVIQWVGGDGNPYTGSLNIPTALIATNSMFYIIGGRMDRWVRVKFTSDTTYQIYDYSSSTGDAVGGVFGIKL